MSPSNPHPTPLPQDVRLRGVGGEAGRRRWTAEAIARASIFVIGMALALVSFGATSLAADPVFAQETTPSDDEVNAVARGLYCPVCENVPLDVCPTQACAQWRATIREKLALGWSDQQIKDYFVDQYGDRVLASPPPRGLNWLVYVLPPLVLIGAGFLLWQTMRRWQKAAADVPPAPAPSEQDPYVQRIEEELRRRG